MAMRQFQLFLLGLFIASLAIAESMPRTGSFFVPNLGQWDGDFAFRFDQGNATYFVTSSGMTADIREAVKRPENPQRDPFKARSLDRFDEHERPAPVRGHVLRLSYVNANAHPELVGEEMLSCYTNYFLSRDSCRWRGHVPNYRNVNAKEVWTGIDVEYKATEQGIETVYHVKPFADPSQIELRYEGSDSPLSVDANGCLQLRTSLGDVTEAAPFAYQIIGTSQQIIPCRFQVIDAQHFRLFPGSYDATNELVIDPLLYSTYVPGSLCDFTIDRDGNKIVCGMTYGGGLPTTPGAYRETNPEGVFAGYVTKFNPTANEYVFSTFVPGAGPYVAQIRTDQQGTIFLFTDALNDAWPLTADAFDTTPGGVADLGLARFSRDGSTLLFSSLLGGSGNEYSPIMEIDTLGRVYMIGETGSTDFPVTSNAWFPSATTGGHLFITIFDPQTSTLIESTYFFPEAYSYPLGRMSVTSPGCFWFKAEANGPGLPTTADSYQREFPYGISQANYFAWIDMNTHQIRYATFLDGFGSARHINLHYFSLIDTTHLLIGGSMYWSCLSFPIHGYDTTAVGQKMVILKFAVPSTIEYGTYLGGSGNWNELRDLHQEPSGDVLLTGRSDNTDFPTTPDAFDRIHHSNGDPDHDSTDVVLCRFSPHLDTLRYSTFIGGDATDDSWNFIIDSPNRVWLSGITNSVDYPITNDALWSQPFGTFLLHFELPPTTNANSRPIIRPSSFSLSAYPNPFNPTTTILFTLPKTERVELNVYNVTGRLVRSLTGGFNPPLHAGEHRIEFDGSDLASGIYFVRCTVTGISHTVKLVLLK